MTGIETLLEEALRSRTADVRPDPHGVDTIAARVLEPSRRLHWAPIVAAAAAVVVVAAGAGLLAAGERGGRPSPAAAEPYEPYLPGHPLPAAKYVVATTTVDPQVGAPVHDVVIDVATGAVAARLPDAGARAVIEPQLTPDGRRAYGVWGNGTRLGYLDLLTGRFVMLIRRPGEISSPTLSADGTTLAYAWTPKLDGNDVTSIVVRTLATGAEKVLTGAPSGPQEIPLALSPHGDSLALVPTDRQSRPVWLVRVAASRPFAHPVVVGFGCPVPAPTSLGAGGVAGADQPRWTQQNLYVLRRCGTVRGTRGPADIMRLDPVTHRATRVLNATSGDGVVLFAAVSRSTVTTMVVWDEDRPDELTTTRGGRTPSRRVIDGPTGLAVSAAQ